MGRSFSNPFASPNTVDADAVIDGSLGAADIADGAITRVKLAPDAVDGTKLADDAVDTEHIADAAVETANLADASVTAAKLAGVIVDGVVAAEGVTAGSVDRAEWGVYNVLAFGATGDGIADDTAEIQAAIDAAELAGGGVVYLPEGDYLVSAPLTIDVAGVSLEGAGVDASTITYTTAIDVLRVTGSFVRVADLTISGAANAGATTAAIIIGYGGANAVMCTIENVKVTGAAGDGVRWDHGPMLRTRGLYIYQPSRHGIYCTNDYDDNNHGVFEAHIVQPTSYGMWIEDDAVTAANASRHHEFVLVKVFAPGSTALRIETDYNRGSVFLEDGVEPQLVLTATAKGNHVSVLSTPSAFANHSDANPNFNTVDGADGYDQHAFKQMRAHAVKVRDTTNEGGLSLAPTGARQFTLAPTDTAGSVDLLIDKGAATSLSVAFTNVASFAAGLVLANNAPLYMKDSGGTSRQILTVLADDTVQIRTAGDAENLTFTNQSTGDIAGFYTVPKVFTLADDWVSRTGKAATASRPSAATVGQGSQFFDTTLNKPIWSDGANWRDAAGTVV